MAPSYSDFSQITELMEIKRQYEEQEEKFRSRLQEKDEAFEAMKSDLELRLEALEQKSDSEAKDEEIGRLTADMERLKADAQGKISQLQERIKELNQKLMGNGARR